MTKFDKVLLSCTGFEAGEHVVVPNPNGFVLEWFPIFSYAGLGVFFLFLVRFFSVPKSNHRPRHCGEWPAEAPEAISSLVRPNGKGNGTAW